MKRYFWGGFQNPNNQEDKIDIKNDISPGLTLEKAAENLIEHIKGNKKRLTVQGIAEDFIDVKLTLEEAAAIFKMRSDSETKSLSVQKTMKEIQKIIMENKYPVGTVLKHKRYNDTCVIVDYIDIDTEYCAYAYFQSTGTLECIKDFNKYEIISKPQAL